MRVSVFAGVITGFLFAVIVGLGTVLHRRAAPQPVHCQMLEVLDAGVVAARSKALVLAREGLVNTAREFLEQAWRAEYEAKSIRAAHPESCP